MNKKDARKADALYVRVDGMYCEHCFNTVSLALKSLDGVDEVSFHNNTAKLTGSDLPDADTIVTAVKSAGYETDAARIGRDRRKVMGNVRWAEFLLIAAALLLAGFAVNRIFGYNIFNAIPVIDSKMSLGMLFVTGLLTSVHCLGMCGAIGLFASAGSGAARSIKRPLLYNLGRVISYTVIGGLVGLVGSVFSFSNRAQGIVILIAALFMLLMSLSMLGSFRLPLPRFFTLRLQKGNKDAFLIGLMNGLMPCGPLQAMQLYALSTGSFLSGALAMFLFALGTVPLMLGSGAVIHLTKGKAKIIVGKVASVLILLLSVSMLYRGLAAFGLDIKTVLKQPDESGYITATVEDGLQTVSFDLEYDAYADIIVQKNIPVRMTIRAEQVKITGCNNEVISNDFGFDVALQPGDNVIEFVPEQEGEYLYTCWMDMIRNHIRVVDHIKE